MIQLTIMSNYVIILNMRRICISIDDATAELLEMYCNKHRIRSAVICAIIKQFFKGGSDNDLTKEPQVLKELLTKIINKE